MDVDQPAENQQPQTKTPPLRIKGQFVQEEQIGLQALELPLDPLLQIIRFRVEQGGVGIVQQLAVGVADLEQVLPIVQQLAVGVTL
jgi:hypothetical protein